MIKFKSWLSKKDKEQVTSLIREISDEYRDFYITKENLRLFIEVNLDLFFDCLKNGDKIAFGDEGIAFITGWSDNFDRKYLKLLAEDIKSADKLLKVIDWHVKTDLYIKIKRNNKLLPALKAHNFVFLKPRGKEVLYFRKYRGE